MWGLQVWILSRSQWNLSKQMFAEVFCCAKYLRGWKWIKKRQLLFQVTVFLGCGTTRDRKRSLIVLFFSKLYLNYNVNPLNKTFSVLHRLTQFCNHGTISATKIELIFKSWYKEYNFFYVNECYLFLFRRNVSRLFGIQKYSWLFTGWLRIHYQ